MSALWILPPLALTLAALAVHAATRGLVDELRALRTVVAEARPVLAEAGRVRDDLTALGATGRREHPR
ncbi:MAG: hypothetical protein AAGK32_02305 [Actinomycetota bacterium]